MKGKFKMEKLSNKEAFAVIIVVIVNTVILVSGQTLIELCSSASLINSIYISIIATLITLLICKLYKKFIGQSILDLAHFVGGKFLQTIVGLIFLTYFLFTMVIFLTKLVNVLQVIYYPMTHFIYIILLFIISTGIICSIKNNGYAKASLIFLGISLITVIAAFIGNAGNFDFNNIYPILGNGINSTFFSGLTNLVSFSGIAYLYFLPAGLNKPHKFNFIAIVSIIVSSIFFIISIATILFMFNNSLSEGELFPMYIAVRYIEFGSFFQRLDSVFLLIRIISFVGFLAITTTTCLGIFKNVTNITDDKPILYPFLLLTFSFSMIIKDNTQLNFLQNTIFKILFFTVVIGLGLLILISANIKHRLNEKKKGYSYE